MLGRNLILLGGPFTPRKLSGLALWYDPSNGAGVVLNGGDVSQLNDLSGQGRPAAQGTAAQQPALTTAGINGRNSVTFTGANNDVLPLTNALTMSQNVGGFSMFGVMKVASLAAVNRVLTLVGGTGLQRFNCQFAITTGKIVVLTRRLDADTSVTTTAAAAAVVTGTPAFCFWQVDYTTGMATLQVGATREVIAITWVGGNGNTENTATSAAPVLGRSGANLYGGDMAEIGMWPRILTTTEIDKLRTYCTTKWGTA